MASLKEFRGFQPPFFFTIPDGEIRRVGFVREPIDFEFLVEHSSPENWRKSSLCTHWTGQCYPCEQRTRPWGQRLRILIPLLHENSLVVLGQGVGNNSLFYYLSDYYKEHGTIRDCHFDLTRTGAGKRTKYTATPVDNSGPVRYTRQVSLENLKKSVDYSEQANYYK